MVKDGRTLFRKAYGMANLELGVPLQPDMVFRLGSITKQFTAAAILMLAEEGKLSLQDPIEKHLPGYPTQGHAITIEHLLTHTSGIQSYTDMPGWMTSRIQGPMTVTELVDGFKKEPMQFAPGERWAYNNSGYILLGAIVEKASGKTYEAFVRERIFEPLGMTSSYYDHTEAILPKRAPGYTREGDQPRNARYLSMTQPYAAGSLASTVDDLARWDASLYTEKLLKKASLDRAWTPYVLKDGKPTGYGYGWGVSTLRGRRAISHGGGIFGFSTYAVRLPDERVYVAVLCNSDSPSADPEYLGKKIAALAVGDPFPEPAAITLDPKVLERYAGVYRIDESLHADRDRGERPALHAAQRRGAAGGAARLRDRVLLRQEPDAPPLRAGRERARHRDAVLPRRRGRARARPARRRRAGRAHGGGCRSRGCTTPTPASTSSPPASSSP